MEGFREFIVISRVIFKMKKHGSGRSVGSVNECEARQSYKIPDESELMPEIEKEIEVYC
jgi:hypothetical protein